MRGVVGDDIYIFKGGGGSGGGGGDVILVEMGVYWGDGVVFWWGGEGWRGGGMIGWVTTNMLGVESQRSYIITEISISKIDHSES